MRLRSCCVTSQPHCTWHTVALVNGEKRAAGAVWTWEESKPDGVCYNLLSIQWTPTPLCNHLHTYGGGMYLFSSFSWFSLSNRTMVQLGGALELFKRPSAQKMRPWWMKTRGVAVGNESTGHWFLQRLWWAAEGEGGSDEIRETRDVNYESEEDSALQARSGARIAWKTKY